MVYVISDLHGQSDAYFDILEQISFSEHDELYILGDIIDRGSSWYPIYQHIRANDNVHLLKGNHEKLMTDFLDCMGGYVDEKSCTTTYSSRVAFMNWMRNGGGVTYDTYLTLSIEERAEIYQYFKNLPCYKIVDVGNTHFILSHARPVLYDGFDKIEDNLESLIEDDEILWCRDIFAQEFPENYKAIHGHSPVQYAFGIDEITSYSGYCIIDIDCGCAFGSKLACLRLDDMKEFYSEKML